MRALDELHVVDGHGGEVRLERLPARAAVPRVPQRRVGPEDEEAAQVRIFAHHARGNVLRPSRVTCTSPSSVPTQITLESVGARLTVRIVLYVSAPEMS